MEKKRNLPLPLMINVFFTKKESERNNCVCGPTLDSLSLQCILLCIRLSCGWWDLSICRSLICPLSIEQ